jgi:hypothetical protein
MDLMNTVTGNGSVNMHNNGSRVSVDECYSSLLGSSQRTNELAGLQSCDLGFLCGLCHAMVELSFLHFLCRSYTWSVQKETKLDNKAPTQVTHDSGAV